MEIEERIKIAIGHKKITYDELAIKTNIGYSRWKNALNGRTKIRWEEIDAICNLFPEYEYWITRGKTASEIGQISPEIETATHNYRKQGKAG